MCFRFGVISTCKHSQHGEGIKTYQDIYIASMSSNILDPEHDNVYGGALELFAYTKQIDSNVNAHVRYILKLRSNLSFQHIIYAFKTLLNRCRRLRKS